MKNIALILMLILSGIAPVSAQVAASSRGDWTLHLKTGGAPWDKKVELELDQSGKLTVTEVNPEHEQNAGTKKFAVELSVKDAREIYEQSLKAIRSFQFAEKSPNTADGTNLNLSLVAYNKSLQMQVFHMGVMQQEEPELAKVFVLINKHLPEEHHVY